MDQTQRIEFYCNTADLKICKTRICINIYLDRKIIKRKKKTTVTRANYSCASEYVRRQAENAKEGICYNRIVKFPTECNYLYGFVKHNLYIKIICNVKEKKRYDVFPMLKKIHAGVCIF